MDEEINSAAVIVETINITEEAVSEDQATTIIEHAPKNESKYSAKWGQRPD